MTLLIELFVGDTTFSFTFGLLNLPNLVMSLIWLIIAQVIVDVSGLMVNYWFNITNFKHDVFPFKIDSDVSRYLVVAWIIKKLSFIW